MWRHHLVALGCHKRRLRWSDPPSSAARTCGCAQQPVERIGIVALDLGHQDARISDRHRLSICARAERRRDRRELRPVGLIHSFIRGNISATNRGGTLRAGTAAASLRRNPHPQLPLIALQTRFSISRWPLFIAHSSGRAQSAPASSGSAPREIRCSTTSASP